MSLKILIVDDEVPLLKNLQGYLGSLDDRFQVLTATSGEEGLAVLERDDDIDVLVTDVRLPGMDGIELVRRVKARKAGLPVVVMSAYGTPDLKREARTEGALTFLEKPVDIEEFRRLLEEAGDSDNGWSGTVGGLDIFDVTQLFAISGRSIAVRVTFGKRSGTLMFQQGRLVHASAGKLSGEEAFFEMARWSGGSFEEIPRSEARNASPNVTMSLSQLMIEAARHRDEHNQRMSRVVEKSKSTSIRPERQPSTNLGKELVMKLAKVEAILNNLKEELGSGLITTDIWAATDGQAIAGVNSQPAADALFNELWDYMQKVLEGSKFPTLNRYIYLDLTDNKAVLILSYGAYRQGLLIDSEKVKMGVLLNVYVPKLLEELPPALA